MTFRCAIFAAVSSRPQVEKESIPSQIANARAFIQRREWQEVIDPLIVPGESRDIDFLHEAMEEVPAIHHLIELARQHTIDLVVIRDYDRLARTRTLLTQISTYLNRCHVQIYALDKPVEPLSPADLARTGQASMTSAMVEAFAGMSAQQEIERLRDRRRFGMNGQAKKGYWKHATCPYGYTRESNAGDGTPIFLDVPEVVPEEAAVIQRIETLYLAGKSIHDIDRIFNLEHIPSPGGSIWRPAVTARILRNPFYSGWIVWGLTRRKKIFVPDTGRFEAQPVPVPAYEALNTNTKHQPNLRDLLDYRQQLIADGAIIEMGQHIPIRTEEQQHAIDAEIETRLVVGGRGASVKAKLPRLFTGLVKCGECGARMSAKTGRHERIYYQCRSPRLRACTNGKSIREDLVYDAVIAIVHRLLQGEAIDIYLQEEGSKDIAAVEESIAEITKALNALRGRRARWDEAYAGEVIDLQTYGEKLGELEGEQTRLQAELAQYQNTLAGQRDQTQFREQLRNWQPQPLTDRNRAELKRQFRTIIEYITVADGEVTKVKFR